VLIFYIIDGLPLSDILLPFNKLITIFVKAMNYTFLIKTKIVRVGTEIALGEQVLPELLFGFRAGEEGGDADYCYFLHE